MTPITLSDPPTPMEIHVKLDEIDRALRKLRWRKQAGDGELADFLQRERARLVQMLGEQKRIR